MTLSAASTSPSKPTSARGTGIEDGREDTTCSGSARMVMTPEKRARVNRQEAANQRLRELGMNSGGSRLPYSVEQLEAVIAILEAS